MHFTISPTGLSPPTVGLPRPFGYHDLSILEGPSTPDKSGLGSSHFARRYYGNRFFFLFLQVLRCFSSLGLSPIWLCIHHMVLAYNH